MCEEERGRIMLTGCKWDKASGSDAVRGTKKQKGLATVVKP